MKDFHAGSFNNWECDVCNKEKFPFTNTDNDELFMINYSSNNKCKCRVKTFKPLNGEMKLLLNQSKESENNHTHKTDQDFEGNAAIKPNFKFYEIHDFHKMTQQINYKTLNVFHSNICSLNVNTENLDILLHDLDYKFDVISLTETWNPESKKENFLPKLIDGYRPYFGITGSSIIGGCGMYVNENLNFIPRKDLDTKINIDGHELECYWIEIINSKICNTIIFFMHFCPGTITTHAESINSDLQRGLDRRLRHIQH